MDEVRPYSRIIRDVISDYARIRPSLGDVRVETVFDEATHHYELIHAGWEGLRRVHGHLIHIDIRDGKVYIEHDGTEDGIAEALVAAGIPKDRIVLAFKPPDIRPYTGYAVA